MKIAAITMRTDDVADWKEQRDSLDRRWLSFLQNCGALPCPLPNNLAAVEEILDRVMPDAVVMTGGGDIATISGRSSDRDMVEARLVEWAFEKGRPLLGICRGMQAILSLAGTTLVPVEGHVGTRHDLIPSRREVNSFHNYGAYTLPTGFEAMECSKDGVVEACTHRRHRTLALMWHPERESPFDSADLAMVSEHLAGGA
jgi:putative glutamine amidotransferase